MDDKLFQELDSNLRKAVALVWGDELENALRSTIFCPEAEKWLQEQTKL